MFRRLRHALRRPPNARMVPFLLLTEAEALPDDEVSCTTAHTHTRNEIFTDIRRPEPGGRPRFLARLACGAACCIPERSVSAEKRKWVCVSLSALLPSTNFLLPGMPTHAHNHVTSHSRPAEGWVNAKEEVLRLVWKTVQMYCFPYRGSSGTVPLVKP